MNEMLGENMGSLYNRTMWRLDLLRSKYQVRVIWEHEVRQELKTNREMREFFEKTKVDYVSYYFSHQKLQVRSRLSPRQALQGGRTDALKSRLVAGPGETIKHYDVVSMYPAMMVKRKFPSSFLFSVSQMKLEFPIGHPVVITNGFGECEHWKEIPYKGLVKCTILPPRKIVHPVLGVKARDSLIFGLCGICIEEGSKLCTHTEEHERALTSTWTHIELNHALMRGYTMVDVIEVSCDPPQE